jgi:copper(I)-binding protein
MRKILSIAAMLMATSAVAGEQVGSIKVSDPVIYKAFENARAAGAYMMISNMGAEDDLLVDVKIEGRMAMIHESREEDGVMRMLHVEAISIPSEGMVEFAPGGFHVMIMGLQPGEFPTGDMVDATLVFDRAGEVPVTFVVTEQGMDHSGHSVSN